VFRKHWNKLTVKPGTLIYVVHIPVASHTMLHVGKKSSFRRYSGLP
jgi:hypothetical protein